MKRIIPLALLYLFTINLSAQEEKEADKATHHIGLQVNPLLQQIVSFGNADEVNNPYLLRYAIRNAKNQNEFNFGLGANFNQMIDQDDLKNQNLGLNFRAGYALNRAISKRLEAGISFDLLVDYQMVRTVAVNNFGGGGTTDSTITKTTTNNLGFGVGPRVTLDYYITPRLKIGTEASLYGIRSLSDQRIETERYIIEPNGTESLTRTDEKEEIQQLAFNFNLPVVIYLTLVF